jgi:FkbM family methyltransferase
VRSYRDQRAEKELRWDAIPGTDLVVLGGNWLAAGAKHENFEIEQFKAMINDADAVIDVGANSGVFSCIAADKGKAVYAFEPMPQILRILAQTVERNNLAAAIEIFPIAASDSCGVAKFYGKGQGASLVKGWADQPSYDAIYVATNTLDRLLGERLAGQKIVIKLDVEGAELAVLRGAEHLLRQCSGLLFENGLSKNVPGGRNATFAPIFELLDAAGFDVHVALPAGQQVTPQLARQWQDAGHAPVSTMNYLATRRPA